MRKILFRGKWIDNGEWVYGNLNYGTIKIKSIKDSYYISDLKSRRKSRVTVMILEDER